MGPLRNLRFGILLLAVAIALFLWGVANGSSSVEVAYDIPVVLSGLKDKFVATNVSVSDVNVRVRGSRAALRNIDPKDLAYEVDASGGRKGLNEFEVEASLVPVPRGVKVVSRSPAVISANFERAGRKAVGVRADIEGSPAAGFRVAGWSVDPPRIWLAGARSEVLRVNEVLTASIDVTGLEKDVEREVRLSLGGGNVWMEDDKRQVTVAVRIEPDPEAQAAVDAAEPASGGAEAPEDPQGATAPEGAG